MQDSDDSGDIVLSSRMQAISPAGGRWIRCPPCRHRHTHTHSRSPGKSTFTVLRADCLEETVANHLISILASTVSHLQHQSAEQNAVEQGQTWLWQSSQCRLLSVGGGGMQRIKINNLAIIRGTVQADTSAD